MSEPLRVAAAVEGPCDTIVLQAILNALLPNTEFELQTLQPEGSAAFASTAANETGVGWVGLFRWSRQAASEGGGSVSGSSVLTYHDVLIVHVDADVAGKTYASGNIRNAPRDDLPCEEPCPPPSATTDALRRVVLSWLGEPENHPRIVLCTPCRNIESWVLAAVAPDNPVVKRDEWECHRNPERQLAALPKGRRFTKRPDDYRRKQEEIEKAWPSVSSRLAEAGRFEVELSACVAALPRHRR